MSYTDDDSLLSSSRTGSPSIAKDIPAYHRFRVLITVRNIRLLFYTLSIYFCYLLYGIMQEKVTKTPFGSKGEQFRSPLFLIFCQSLANSFVAMFGMILVIGKKERKSYWFGAPVMNYSLVAATNVAAMFCTNASLLHVDYPTQVLGKSCKPISIMLFGLVLFRKKYPPKKYFAILLLCVGISLFSISRMSTNTASHEDASDFLGYMFLLMSLSFDGITASTQDMYVSKHKPTSYQLMCAMNLFAIIYSTVALLFSGQFLESVIFQFKDWRCPLYILCFSITSAFGQIFIFMTITHFGSLTCAIITTSRKFFSILVSVVLHGHPIPFFGWIGVSIVFFSLGMNMLTKTPSRPVVFEHSKPPLSPGGIPSLRDKAVRTKGSEVMRKRLYSPHSKPLPLPI